MFSEPSEEERKALAERQKRARSASIRIGKAISPYSDSDSIHHVAALEYFRAYSEETQE